MPTIEKVRPLDLKPADRIPQALLLPFFGTRVDEAAVADEYATVQCVSVDGHSASDPTVRLILVENDVLDIWVEETSTVERVVLG